MRRFRSVIALILFVALLLPTIPVPSTAYAIANSAFGINAHIATRYPVFETLNRAADVVAGTEAGWVREDFQMHRIQPRPGEFDWGFHDKMVQLHTDRNVQILGVLGPAVGWATPFAGDGNSDVSFYAPDITTFANFAKAVVERYKGKIRYWQVWNEPENATYYKPAPDPNAYGALLRATYNAIKAADPNAQVLNGGVVPFDQSFLRALGQNGSWSAFDILAVHPYVDPNTPEAGQIGASGIGAVKALADSFGAKPIWVTEFGWATGPSDRDPAGRTNDDQQANYLIRASAMLRAAGAERIFWFSLRDELNNPYGLYRGASGPTDYSQPKPSLAAFQTLNRMLAGTSVVGYQDTGARQVVFTFEQFGNWRRGDQPNGTFTQSTEQSRSGANGKLSYSFPGGGNDYVVFSPSPAINLPGSPSQLGAWVYGDGTGNQLKVWLRDSQGEVLQFRLGAAGRGWQFLTTVINGPVESFNRISGGGNLQLDFPASLVAIVLDDEPDSFSGSGSIYLDDLTVLSGPEAYNVRFSRGNEVIDVIWAPNGGQVNVASSSANATLTDRFGGQRAIASANGRFVIDAGSSPVFLTHAGGNAPPPPPPPPPASGPCRDFPETGKRVCGRILEYWDQNGGLPVFGYPITDQFEQLVEGRARQVQFFERNRFELTPENQRPYDVLLGRLGDDVLRAQGRDWQQFPKRGDPSSPYYFPQTGQSIAPEFVNYWRSNGLEFDGRAGKSFEESLALFGLPLSPPQVETNSSGDTVLTQWFERARFEYHPNNPEPFKVLLGLLGREVSGIK